MCDKQAWLSRRQQSNKLECWFLEKDQNTWPSVVRNHKRLRSIQACLQIESRTLSLFCLSLNTCIIAFLISVPCKPCAACYWSSNPSNLPPGTESTTMPKQAQTGQLPAWDISSLHPGSERSLVFSCVYHHVVLKHPQASLANSVPQRFGRTASSNTDIWRKCDLACLPCQLQLGSPVRTATLLHLCWQSWLLVNTVTEWPYLLIAIPVSWLPDLWHSPQYR